MFDLRKNLALTSVFSVAALLLSMPLHVIAQVSSLARATSASTPKAALLPGHLHTTAVPMARIATKIDESRRTLLRGHVPGALRHAVDMGHLATATPVQHLVMVLQSSDEQKRELRRVLDEQQDQKSANYHQWVTPEQFGDHFGVHDADIAKISDWLKSQGFEVEDVSKSKRVIRFSGTTGKLENAFKTEIHTFQVGAEMHISNNSEISVPEALSPVIAGVTMNNFFRKGHMGPVKQLKDVLQTEKAQPLYTSSSTTHYVGPWDFATIYNTFPLLNKGITGAGSSIAVVGRSDILLSDVQTYRQMFNLPENDPIFIHAGQDNGTEPGDDGESDLDVEISGGIAPNAQVYFVVGTPTFFVDGITNSIEYIVENNTADIMSISYGSCESVEGIGGNAYNNQAFEQAAAQGISVFVASGDNGPAECDNSNNTYENLGYATGSESSTPYSVSVGGSQGYEASSYWNSTIQQAPYWGESAISYLPEVPWNESRVANKSLDAAGSLGGIWSGSGGISSYYLLPSWQRGSNVPTTDPTLPGGNWVTGVTFTNAGSGYVTAPTVTFTGGGCVTEPVATTTISGGAVASLAFNYGVQGGTLKAGQGFGCTSAPTVAFGAAPAGGTTATGTALIGQMWNVVPLIQGVPHRYTPDLVLNAASGHDATLFCSEGNCQTSTSGGVVSLVSAGLVGGTSVAAPSMAGIQALINQANGGRQGMPGYIYYALSAAQNATNCNSTLGNTIGSGCVFQDITQGDNLICGASTCTANSATQKMGFTAGTGYDLASGLGSVNAANMAAQWSSVTFNSSTTSLNLSKTSGISQGTPVTISGTVTPGSGSGTPTGDVAFIVSNGIIGQTIDISGDANNGAANGPGAFAKLNNGNYSATLSNLPGGSYTVTARYAGDANFASSLSAPVAVTVAAGNSTITITPQSINQTACTLTNTSSFTYGGLAWIPATVTGTTGQGVPTGTVTITVDGATWGTVTLDPNGNGYLVAGAVPTSSCLYGYIFSQGALLTGGTHSIGASYSGDGTFSPATATPVTVTVAPLTVTPTLAAGATFITAGAADQLTATFGLSALTGITSGIAGPTGTVTFMDTTTGAALGTANVVNAVAFSGNTYTYSAFATLTTTAITTIGANAITATYSGNASFASTTSVAVTVTVGTGTATSVTVTSSANPTTLGGRPTFTATLTGGPVSGTVTFYDGTAVLGTGTVGTAHTATYRPATTTAFFGGTHNITAAFGGVSGTYLASTSPVFVETVTQGTAPITLTVKNSGTAGKNYTFAAVLAPSSTGAVFAPNQGLVNFYDGSTLLGSAQPITITAAQGGYGLWTATFTYSGFTAGTHTVTATYSDVNYSLTTSAAQTVKVYGLPLGNLELAADISNASTTIPQSDTLYVSGWAADAVDGGVSNVKIYIDGVLSGAATTGVSRPDVVSATGNNGYGNSGYTYTTPVSALSAGTHVVTAVATDTGSQATTFGPLRITVTYSGPVGGLGQAIDAQTGSSTVAQADQLFVSGWVADPTDGSPLSNVKVLIDGTVVGTPTLGISRPDVVSATGKSAYANSGYTFYYSATALAAGSHRVTVMATNSHGVSTVLGPLTFTVTYAAPVGGLGQVIGVTSGTSSLSQSEQLFASGWVGDPADGAPLSNVQVLIDGNVIGPPTLGLSRPDVVSATGNSAYAKSGFTFYYNASAISIGSHTMTVVATNSHNISTTLGPQNFTVTAKPPIGALATPIDATTFATGTISKANQMYVYGWAADYQDNGPAQTVQVLIDGVAVGNATEGQASPDVATTYNNAAWSNVGYSVYYSVSSLGIGTHTLTTVATNSLGISTTLGPVTFNVVQ